MYKKLYSFGTRICLSLLLSIFSIFASFAQNAIVTENALPGTPQATWDINGSGDLSIQGFATDISVNKGGTISFKIDVNTGTDKTFDIQIYRIGYYQGNGARLIADLGNFTGIAQNACIYDGTTGLTDCGNWTVTTSWNVPATVVSGLYIAKLTRSVAGGGGSSHIAFVVRDDASTSALYFQTSDATWQAYNNYGGNSLYVGAGLPNNHASKVSYNRPFLTRNGGGGGGAMEDWFMNSEYPMIRFLERNGFDMSYTSDVDVARSGNLILQHKVFLSVGHDEYWSKEQRNSVEAARAAAINLAFFGGNEVYWKTRWENSTDGTNTPWRTLVCYKEGTLATPQENPCGGKCDPNTEWTGLWRDGCSFPTGNACKPENALSGNISWDGQTSAITVPAAYKNLRFWRNTSITGLAAGQTATLAAQTLGYEWDWEQYFSSYPSGRITMSSTTFDGRIHKLSLYKHASGAWVFSAGTVQWAWGLDINHDRPNGDVEDPRMQQATINLFADMGVQPATLMAGLVLATPSTDVTPPTTVITSPVNGAILPQGSTAFVSGTATDAGGGAVGGVEISLDGGVTWQAVTGTTNWTFSWVPQNVGPLNIRVRGFDDSGNMEATSTSSNNINVTIGPPAPCPCSLFVPSQTPTDFANDNSAIELGVKFRTSVNGYITAIRFYKHPSDNALNSVHLWTKGGALLGSADLTGTPTGGWTEVTFASPIFVKADTTYIASYFSPTGYYDFTSPFFDNAVTSGPITAIGNLDPDGPNGVYRYSTVPAMPTDSYYSSNYWVDVKFSPANAGPDVDPPLVEFTVPANNATNIGIGATSSVTFNEDIDPATVTNNTLKVTDPGNVLVPGLVTYTVGSRTATFTPSAPLNYSTTYTATVIGGATDPRIKDLAGNALSANYAWSFTIGPQPQIPPDEGGDGPVLVISDTANPFTRYPVEILRAQGYVGFKAMDIREIRSNQSIINNYDIIILGQMPVTAGDVTMLTTWTNAGGTLIALRPDPALYPLMGIASASGTLSDKYLLVNTAAGQPGAGIVNQTIQFHGAADRYTMAGGTTSLGTLYSNATTATVNPAITSVNVGANGGKAVAFAYDLARSIVYTRQGNPAWAGQSRDGQIPPIRSDNLFFGNAAFDPETDWVDLNKVAIPQADEQQHLLTNIMSLGSLHKKPMPHLWILPRGLKAAVIMTGDEHGNANTIGRFNEYMTMGPNSAQDVADWNAVRGTSYVYPSAMTDAQAASFQSNGFEIGFHPTTDCVDFSASSLDNVFTSQELTFQNDYPSLNKPVTNRTHCMVWSDWSTHAETELAHGVRFDVNYYYWPDVWVQNRPGMFTGSGMPMRFAKLNGSIIDVYQAPTQLPDESGLDIPSAIASLLDKAIGVQGYYGAFVMNMHTDTAISVGSDEVIAAAQSRSIPVISSKQMLDWLDSRNGTVFGPMTWSNNQLSFTVTTTAHNLQVMVPVNSANGTLIQVNENGSPVSFTSQTIKGIPYGFFNASTNSYVAIYSATPLPVTLLDFTVTKQNLNDALLQWSTSMEQNNKGFEIQRSTDATNWAAIGFVNSLGNNKTLENYQYVDRGLSGGTYYYRLRQVDLDGKYTYSKTVQITIDGDMTLQLMQNQPNPFFTNTTIVVVIPQTDKFRLTLYDAMGRPVQQIWDEVKTPGTYRIQFSKNGLSAGAYYYKLESKDHSLVKKMTIL